jgi:hypothetical protein
MRADGRGDVRQIRGQALNDPLRRREMTRQPPRYGDARWQVHCIEQAQRQFGIVPLLVRRMCKFLYVEVGENAQQRGAHIDPATQSETGEVFKIC